MNITHKIFNIKELNLIEFQLKIAFDHHQINKKYVGVTISISNTLLLCKTCISNFGVKDSKKRCTKLSIRSSAILVGIFMPKKSFYIF